MAKKTANRCIYVWLGVLAVGFTIVFGFWVMLFTMLCSGIAAPVGVAAAGPGGSSGSGSYRNYDRSSSYSSSGSSRSDSGGGGSSGGGGISRKF